VIISRRKILQMALLSPLASVADLNQQSPQVCCNTETEIVPYIKGVSVTRRWNGPICHSQLTNHTREAVRIERVVLFGSTLPLPGSSRLYGEGFQMLSQTGGTMNQPVDLGNYTDAKHYRLPVPAGLRAYYGMLMLSPSPVINHLFAFTSCHRFVGQFYLNGTRVAAGRNVAARDLHVQDRQRSRTVTRRAERATRRQSSTAPLSETADRLVLVVLLRPTRDRAAGVGQSRLHREEHARPALHPDRRRLSARDG
jgi:hypothetical protein